MTITFNAPDGPYAFGVFPSKRSQGADPFSRRLFPRARDVAVDAVAEHVLTAGHCVFLLSQGGWATSIRAMPGLDGMVEPFEQAFVEPFGHAFMVKKRSVTCWTQSLDWECDYGLITLDKTFNLGSFGLLSLSNDTLDNSWAQIIGYPEIGKPPGTQQFFVPGGGQISLAAERP
jgi:hypothetical protein